MNYPEPDKLSEEFRCTFGFSKPESIISTYPCAYGTQLTTLGTLYISQNNICFLRKDMVIIPFVKIISMRLTDDCGPRKIEIQTEDEVTHIFSLFSFIKSPKQAFRLMYYLWKNRPHILNIRKFRMIAAQIECHLNNIKDVNLKDINEVYKYAERYMKNIESQSFYLFGNGGLYTDDIFESESHKKSEGDFPEVEIEAILKRDSLEPCIISFQEKFVEIINPKNEKHKTHTRQYPYLDIKSITIHLKSEYLIITLTSKKKIKLYTSYRQIITNQIFSRLSKLGGYCDVEFQYGSDTFEYKDDWICKIPPDARGIRTNDDEEIVRKLLSFIQKEEEMENIVKAINE
jgi:hypothetical protein